MLIVHVHLFVNHDFLSCIHCQCLWVNFSNSYVELYSMNMMKEKFNLLMKAIIY